MKDKRMLLAGLAAGALGGLLVGKLAARGGREPRRMPYLDVANRC